MIRPIAYLPFAFLLSVASVAFAQTPSGPPSVGVVRAEQTAITETSEFIGRIQAIDRVALTARVTAFLEERLFTEGAEVKKGDLLYRLERPPFEAAVRQQEAVVADTSARLANANIQLARAQSLLSTPAGQRSNVDDATANTRSLAAQVLAAQAQLKVAQINLDYTEIRAPVDGKISRTNITAGNVVSPSAGPLATVVSQDPMYVLFPVASRAVTELQKRYAEKGGMDAIVVRLRLPDGSLYDHDGKIDYIEPTVAATTDTITLRARIANPPRCRRPTGDRWSGRWWTEPSWAFRSKAFSRSWRSVFRASPFCPTSRATTSMSSAPTTRSSSAAFSWDNPRPAPPLLPAG